MTRTVLYSKWDQSAIPTNPHSRNDEFIGSYSGKWTIFDQNGNLSIYADKYKGIALQQATAASYQIAGIYVPVPSGDYTIMIKMCPSWGIGSGEPCAGLAFWEDPTDNTKRIEIFGRTTQPATRNNRNIRSLFTDWQTWNTNRYLDTDAWMDESSYIRVHKNSSGHYTYLSTTGDSWIRVSTIAIPFTPVAAGLFISNRNVGESIHANFEFFRFLPYDAGNGGHFLGNKVDVLLEEF